MNKKKRRIFKVNESQLWENTMDGVNSYGDPNDDTKEFNGQSATSPDILDGEHYSYPHIGNELGKQVPNNWRRWAGGYGRFNARMADDIFDDYYDDDYRMVAEGIQTPVANGVQDAAQNTMGGSNQTMAGADKQMDSIIIPETVKFKYDQFMALFAKLVPKKKMKILNDMIDQMDFSTIPMNWKTDVIGRIRGQSKLK